MSNYANRVKTVAPYSSLLFKQGDLAYLGLNNSKGKLIEYFPINEEISDLGASNFRVVTVAISEDNQILMTKVVDIDAFNDENNKQTIAELDRDELFRLSNDILSSIKQNGSRLQ